MEKSFRLKMFFMDFFDLTPLALGFFALRSKGIVPKGSPKREQRTGGQTALELKSSAFEDNDIIPKNYTCEGENISPPLKFSHVPEETQSLALIVFDPDAEGGWTHWTVFNIPANIIFLEAGEKIEGAIEGQTDFGKTGYGGPCPPKGMHHYEFKLYALDSRLALDNKATKKDIEHAMEGHIIAQTVLTGFYQKTH